MFEQPIWLPTLSPTKIKKLSFLSNFKNSPDSQIYYNKLSIKLFS